MADDPLLQKAIEILDRIDPLRRMAQNDALEALIDRSQTFAELYDEDRVRLTSLTADAIRRGTAATTSAPRRSGAPSRRAPTRPAPDAAMLTAPYRFVVLNDQIVPAQDVTKVASWGFPIPGGFCGEIEVEWAFETPMLIGVEDDKGVAGPMQLGDDYVIPGATLRGMMRASMGIVCRARLTQLNANHRYGVRDFTHPLFKQGAGAQRLAWEKLGAGWLRKVTRSEGEKKQGLDDYYTLTPCDKAMVRIRALPRDFNHGRPTDNGEWHRDWLRMKLGERYGKAGYAKGKDERKKDLFDFEDPAKTMSFMRDPLTRDNDPTAGDHVVPGAGKDKGWFVFSSNSPSLKHIDPRTLDEQQKSPRQGDQKKREYVFLDRPEDEREEIRLTQQDFENFERINSKPGKTKLKPDGSYAVMAPTLDAGRRIPVFYVGKPGGDDPNFAMGLTRLFKLPHANSVGDVLAAQGEGKWKGAHKPVRGDPDMIEALFGHVYDRLDLEIVGDERVRPGEVARKGRIAFGFAKLSKDTPAAPTEIVTTTAMGPRASYAPFYLRGPIKDWTDEAFDSRNSGKARLAGRKRYFPRFPSGSEGAAKAIETTLTKRKSEESTDTQSKLRLLKPMKPGGELVFAGTIRLHNVTAEEAGALLWTLTHGGDPNKPCRHMIGRAKNAGAGQARVRSVRLKLDAHPGRDSRKALLDEAPARWETQGVDGGWLARGGQSLAPFLRAFESYMREKADAYWPQTDDICEFLGVCDPTLGAELKADFLPTPNDFGKLRRFVKADVNNDPAPVTKANDRLMPAPRAAQVLTPYR